MVDWIDIVFARSRTATNERSTDCVSVNRRRTPKLSHSKLFTNFMVEMRHVQGSHYERGGKLKSDIVAENRSSIRIKSALKICLFNEAIHRRRVNTFFVFREKKKNVIIGWHGGAGSASINIDIFDSKREFDRNGKCRAWAKHEYFFFFRNFLVAERWYGTIHVLEVFEQQIFIIIFNGHHISNIISKPLTLTFSVRAYSHYISASAGNKCLLKINFPSFYRAFWKWIAWRRYTCKVRTARTK